MRLHRSQALSDHSNRYIEAQNLLSDLLSSSAVPSKKQQSLNDSVKDSMLLHTLPARCNESRAPTTSRGSKTKQYPMTAATTTTSGRIKRKGGRGGGGGREDSKRRLSSIEGLTQAEQSKMAEILVCAIRSWGYINMSCMYIIMWSLCFIIIL